MKSRGLFPSRRGAAPTTNRNRSAAGDSTGSGPGRSGTDGYKQGELGDRAGRPAGGASMAAMIEDRPKASDRTMPGNGGCAWDRSMAAYAPDGYEREHTSKTR